MTAALAPELERNIRAARDDARRRGLERVTIEHLLLELLDNPEVQAAVNPGADIAGLRNSLQTFVNHRVPRRKIPGDAAPADNFLRVLHRAAVAAQNRNAPVNGLHILAAVYAERESPAAYYLQKHGVERLEILARLASHPPHSHPPPSNSNPAASRPFPTHFPPDPAHAQPSHPGGQTVPAPVPGAPGGNRPRAVELCALAAAGTLEAPFGRDREVAQAARALARKYKNNPVLVGEPGVGKTAVVHALAHRVARGEVPPVLAGMKIFSVSVSDLVAGAKYRGDFEQRMRDLLEKCRAAENAALFIDEIHSVVGAGAASGGALDAANILKPALSVGGVRCIGATTFSEFRRVFEKDAALARRFQPVAVREPDDDELQVILSGVVARLSAHHGVSFSPDAPTVAVDLSRRWLPNKFLPDKAIDILDDAGAHWRLQNKKTNGANGKDDAEVVNADDLAHAVSRLCGRPTEVVSQSDARRLSGLERKLAARVLDQPEAMRRLAGAVLRARLGYGEARQAAGAFLFTGPTGVGKTETAKRLAELLCAPLLRYDMSEYAERHSASRLIGAPPGYVGFDQGGKLTEDVSRNPGAVVLFDEAEKAHPDVLNLLLQVTDYGALTDGGGRRADFSGATIILTSNAGAAEWERIPAGFGRGAKGNGGNGAGSYGNGAGGSGKGSGSGGIIETPDERAGDEAVSRMFSPEFRNRLDAIVRFHPLGESTVAKILSRRLSELQTQMRDRKKIQITFGRKLRLGLRRDGFSPAMGARPLERLLRERVLEPLARAEAEGLLTAGGKYSAEETPSGTVVAQT